jgi:predicted O-linked N-acetylglucosamine transferase (SPINDLY family)
MPPGTPSEKVLKAVQRLALNEWQLKHRYAMALHTDDHHPHVHVVLKAISEEGERLNIKKATLRSWRLQFAANLRELGVAANATERAVRGQTRTRKLDPIYRAAERGMSTHVRARWSQAFGSLTKGSPAEQPGGETLRRTRREVVEGWRQVAANLRANGDHVAADEIKIFLGAMSPPLTEQERFTERLREKVVEKRARDIDRTR